MTSNKAQYAVKQQNLLSKSRHVTLSKKDLSRRSGIVKANALSPIETLTANLFAGSLFPYLGFLYYISRKKNGMNMITNLGFQFLLLFVGASIPASIVAINKYQSTLSDVDWLHGSAEGLLTVTNLLIVLGLRMPTEQEQKTGAGSVTMWTALTRPLGVLAFGTLLASFITLFWEKPSLEHDLYFWGLGDLLSFSFGNSEPQNALSIPTWMVHWSSLLEWLVAMRLIWDLQDRTQNPNWKYLTWGMVPLHTSALCACTYHLFFNEKSLVSLQLVQAATTVLGNSLMMAASWKIAKSNGWTMGEQEEVVTDTPYSRSGENKQAYWERESLSWRSEVAITIKLVAIVTALSYITKYGELLFDFPYQHDINLAFAIVFLPSLANIANWISLENSGDDGDGNSSNFGKKKSSSEVKPLGPPLDSDVPIL
eukprot:CAMPEP_0167742738 /NCGR_PEP_ID=MMETSP0110_2-20121227/1606_1 /TAXON_ID=629695 /ORGANISM="Gymnochlora sp., Strain CCMP2014" /LENGTH=424 /DNA_ID=CAMNT_0007626989 /DNA_START=61 /DNA_END=1335 /DNA_ORIENTATION=-